MSPLGFLTRAFGANQQRSSRSRKPGSSITKSRLRVESLEDRAMLSGCPVVSHPLGPIAPVSASVVSAPTINTIISGSVNTPAGTISASVGTTNQPNTLAVTVGGVNLSGLAPLLSKLNGVSVNLAPLVSTIQSIGADAYSLANKLLSNPSAIFGAANQLAGLTGLKLNVNASSLQALKGLPSLLTTDAHGRVTGFASTCLSVQLYNSTGNSTQLIGTLKVSISSCGTLTLCWSNSAPA